MSIHIDQFLGLLEDVEYDLREGIKKEILDADRYITGSIVAQRLFQGISGDGSLIGRYAPATIYSKQRRGKYWAHVTLRETGSFYQSLDMRWKGDELELFSHQENTQKVNFLIDKYGQSILEFAERDAFLIFKRFVEPFVKDAQKKLNQGLDLDIDLNG